MQDIYKVIQQAISGGETNRAKEMLDLIPQLDRNFDWYQLSGYADGNLGNYENALFSLGRAYHLNPNNLEVLFYLAIAQFKTGAIEESIKNLESVSKKSKFNKEVTDTLIDVACLSQNYEIASKYLKIIIQKTSQPELYIRRQIEIAIKLSKYEDAINAYQSLDRIGKKVSEDWGHENYLRMILCDWSKYDKTKNLLTTNQNSTACFTPTQLLSLPSNAEQQYLAAKKFSSRYSSNLVSIKKDVFNQEKIKVGYFSSDFHNHATAYLVAEMFELHNREFFEIHGFSYGPERNDQLRDRIKNGVDYFYDLNASSDDEIVELSRKLKIDIAVDLKGYGVNQRINLFAQRLAQVQVNYLVYPGTMGTLFHDYLIADKYVIPETQQKFYSEKVIYLDSCYQVSDRKRPSPEFPESKIFWGLSKDAFIFACFNNNYKITPEIFDVWSKIILETPGSQLWLLEDNLTAKKNIIKEAKKRGVTKNRIIFAPRVDIPKHLARHQHVDLMLDTPYYNAHTTANDALWMGVPILTIEGNTFCSRVCGSLLKDVFLEELICKNLTEYKEKAVNLALDNNELLRIKKHLVNKHNLPLFNSLSKTQNIENLYKSMLRKVDSV